MLRHLVESGTIEQVDGRWVRAEGADEFEVPEGVREVIGRRVSRLSPLAAELLTVAAVAGSEFDTAVVAEVAGQPTAQALDGFDEALAARLVLDADAPGRLRFPHALVQQTLEEELSTLRRLHLHQGLGLAIERRAGTAEGAVAELAHHFAEAAALGEHERAVRYAERAAGQAMDRGAKDQAADLLQSALDMLPAELDPDGLWRDPLYDQLARCVWSVFDQERMEETTREWLQLGRDLDDGVIRARAVMSLALSYLWRRVPDPEDYTELAAALHVDPQNLNDAPRRRFGLRGSWSEMDASSFRATLLANLAAYWSVGIPLDAIRADLPGDDPVAVADEACRLAAESDDREIADETRYLRSWTLLSSPDAAAQLEAGQRGARLGYMFGGGGWIPAALALVRLGRLDDLRAWRDEMLLAAAKSGDRALLGNVYQQQATEAVARGRFEEGRGHLDKALAVRPDQVAFQVGHSLVTVARLLHSGQADEARPIADELEANPGLDSSHLVAVVAAAQGDLGAARALLGTWHGAECPIPLDHTRCGRLWGLAECAHVVGDARPPATFMSS